MWSTGKRWRVSRVSAPATTGKLKREKNMETIKEREKLYNELKPFIGEMVIKFSAIESNMVSLISSLITTPFHESTDFTEIIIDGMSFTARLKLMDRLVRHHLIESKKGENYLSSWVDIISKMESCNKNRNNIVHAIYEDLDPKTSRVKLSTKVGKKGLQKITSHITTEQIKTIIRSIEDVDDDLYQFHCDGDLWG